MFIVFHSFPLFFHWFSFMCFTIFIIFIFLFFFPGCIGFFRCEPSFFAWHVLGLEPSARQFNRNPDVLDDDDNDDDGDNDFSMVFIDFSMFSSVFHWPPSMSLLFSFFLLVSSILHGCFHCFSMVGTGFSMVFIVCIRQSTHLRLQNFLTCASYSLAPPTLTCASDLAHLRLQYSLAPPQCYDWIVSLSLNVPPLCLPPCDHLTSKSLFKLSPPSTMRPSDI